MQPDDIIGLPVTAHGVGIGKFTRYHSAKCVAAENEQFAFEFIEGPLDGERVRYSRAELDRLLKREGGEEWKEETK